jgi:hypothetical protein
MKYVIASLVSLALLACSKKPSKQITGSWSLEKIEFSDNGGPFESQDLDCNQDDTWMFEKDGIFKISDGIDLCGSGEGTTGTWSVDDEDDIISFTYDGFSGVYTSTIVELTKETLITEHDPGFTTPAVYRYTFSAY